MTFAYRFPYLPDSRSFFYSFGRCKKGYIFKFLLISFAENITLKLTKVFFLVQKLFELKISQHTLKLYQTNISKDYMQLISFELNRRTSQKTDYQLALIKFNFNKISDAELILLSFISHPNFLASSTICFNFIGFCSLPRTKCIFAAIDKEK